MNEERYEELVENYGLEVAEWIELQEWLDEWGIEGVERE